MQAFDGIRRLGFRRWYERQLVEGHAWLVTCFLCMILVAASVEGFSLRAPGVRPLMMAGLVLGGLVLCAYSWRRYLRTLGRAEFLAERSTCAGCGTYGRYELLQASGSPGPATGNAPSAGYAMRLHVQCRQCSHRWTIE